MYDDDLNNLEDWLRRLKVEYDIFFNGHRKRPPDDLRMRLERLAKQLSEAGDMSFQQRFRYNTLVARYYVYKDLWRRTLSDREATADISPHGTGTAVGQHAVAGASTAAQIEVALSDPASEEGRVRELYRGITRLGGTDKPETQTIPFERFAAYLARQTREVREKYGCRRVIFTLAIDNASVRFKARPDTDPA